PLRVKRNGPGRHWYWPSGGAARSGSEKKPPAACLRTRRADRAQASLAEVEAVGVHDLRPRGDEVTHELLLAVVLGIHLRIGTQDGVGAEHQIDAGRGPLLCATVALDDV